ncbi:MAG: hypothetical protein WBH39_14105 [Candidatus Microthrix parvicella]
MVTRRVVVSSGHAIFSGDDAWRQLDAAVVGEEFCGGDVVVVVGVDFEVIDGDDPLVAGDRLDGSGGVVALGEVVSDL